MKSIVKAMFLLVLISGTCGLSSCKKDNKSTTPKNPVKKGMLMFHLHNYVSENEVDAYGPVYTSDAGRQISLSLSQFYLSGIYLLKEDGSRYDLSGVMIIKTLDKQTYMVAEVPVGTYKTLGFNVGLGSDTSSKSPSTSSTDALNHPEMWFGSTAQPEGYIYFNAQGKVDTTANANGSVADMQSFNYKIGTEAHSVAVVMPQLTLNITEDAHEYAHLIVDYGKLFNGFDLSDPANLHVASKAENTSWIANTISTNIASMFRYE